MSAVGVRVGAVSESRGGLVLREGVLGVRRDAANQLLPLACLRVDQALA